MSTNGQRTPIDLSAWSTWLAVLVGVGAACLAVSYATNAEMLQRPSRLSMISGPTRTNTAGTTRSLTL